MKVPVKYLSLIPASLFFVACGGGDISSANSGESIMQGEENDPKPITNGRVLYYPNPTPTLNSIKNITIKEENQIEDLGQGNNVKATINVGQTPKSLYVLISNHDERYTSVPKLISSGKNVQTNKRMKDVAIVVPTIHAKRSRHAPAYIQVFNRNIKKLLKDTPSTGKKSKKFKKDTNAYKKDVEGASKRFYFEQDRSKSTTATARKVISNISTVFGPKTLNIWVSNDSFDSGSGCDKTKCVTQDMVNTLANTFLKTGKNNDIYDWVTNIYGEEWNVKASKMYKNLLGSNNEITILLTDIDGDNSANGGVIGFFYAKDNLNKVDMPGSNERVMFYIDAVMFANNDGSKLWSIDDKWPKEIVSTLAHEFVHMIEFCQKSILRDKKLESDTWLAEMIAETTEDLIATKIESSGPRGVAYTDGSAGEVNNEEGRYGLFNENNTLSLTTWRGALADYSKVNAFGTYLTRNYGGGQVLHDIMHNDYVDEKALEYAVHKASVGSGKTFADLQKEWGIAVLLSDQEHLAPDKPTYNTGDFTVSQMGDVEYEMGAINFFNYVTKPTFSSCTTVKPQANCYYKVGDNLSGKVTIDLTLNDTTSATLIVK